MVFPPGFKLKLPQKAKISINKKHCGKKEKTEFIN